VGAGGALTPGVNRLPPVGLMPFSVGEGGTALDDGGDVVVVVVVVDEVEGACSPLLPHPARNAPIAISAPPPTTATKRGVNGFELMVQILSSRDDRRCDQKIAFWVTQPTLSSH
jgi:hypothetical protein